MTRYIGQQETDGIWIHVAIASVDADQKPAFEAYAKRNGFTQLNPLGEHPELSYWTQHGNPPFISYLILDDREARLEVEAPTKPEVETLLYEILNGHVKENHTVTQQQLR